MIGHSPRRRASPARRLVGFALLLLLPLCLVFGIFHSRVAEPPSPREILDRYVEVTGGADAYSAITCLRTRGVEDNVIDHVTRRFVEHHATSGRHHARFESELHGIHEEGCDGEVAWSSSLLDGPLLKAGVERALALREAYPDRARRWKDWIREVECTGPERVGDEPCFRLELETHGGRPETHHYSLASGLLIRRELTRDQWIGVMPQVIHYADYRGVAGILIPHQIRIEEAMGDEIRITIDGAEALPSFPKGLMELPEEIRALVEKG